MIRLKSKQILSAISGEFFSKNQVKIVQYIYIKLKPVVTGFLYIKNHSKPVVAVPVVVFENRQKKTAGCSPGFPILDQKPDLTGLQNTSQDK